MCMFSAVMQYEICNMDTFFAFMVLHCVKATFFCAEMLMEKHTLRIVSVCLKIDSNQLV